MAGTVKYHKLETRTVRMKLPPGRNVYWRSIVAGKSALGYQRKRTGEPGRWLLRRFDSGRYSVEALGFADDYPDDLAGISFEDALADAQRRVGHRTGPLTVAGACAIYVESLTNAGRPYGDTEGRFRNHVLPGLGEMKVEELTTARLQQWLADLARLGEPEDEVAARRGQSTANRVLNILRAALNHAFDNQLVASNDAWGRRLKSFRAVDEARVRYLQVDEATRLINAADAESGFRDLILAGLNTGARLSELGRLKVRDFNPDAGTIYVAKSKSGKARHVHLTDEGVAHFAGLAAGRTGDEPLLVRRAKRAERDPKGKLSKKTDRPMLLRVEAAGPWRSSDQTRLMADAVKNAKISPPISFHGMRHTYASLAIMNGVPLQVVATNLGHVDTSMVEKHYGHLAPSYIRDAIRAGAPRFAAPKRNVRAIR